MEECLEKFPEDTLAIFSGTSGQFFSEDILDKFSKEFHKEFPEELLEKRLEETLRIPGRTYKELPEELLE